MSTPRPTFTWIFLGLLMFWAAAMNTPAQAFEAEIKIDADRSIAAVSGKFLTAGIDVTHVNLSFAGSVAGHRDVAKRIRGLEIFDQRGAPAPLRKLIDGEYLAEAGVVSWRYEVDLAPSKDINAAAHVSWISGGKGLLMLGDVLPEAARSGKVTIRVPVAWSMFTSETAESGNVFNISDTSRAVFAVGRELEAVRSSDSKVDVDVLVSGQFHFTPPEADEMAREIFVTLQSVLGDNRGRRRQIILSNFPHSTGPGRWQAETRGDTVTIISSDMPFRTQSLQRLHEQLRHELFHLWIPNGVNLTGNYDWFYEGFALYQSLKLAVALNRIRFEDFLDTLSRAHTIDSAQSQRSSLIQASASRFGGMNTQVYARGMLVAFLCDLAMLQRSKGKRSVENLLKELFEKHRKPASPVDGNTAVLAILRSNPNVIPVVDKYIAGTDRIDWAPDLAFAGIEDSDPGPLTRLQVKQKLDGREKALLDKLGYNNWRKLSRTSK